MAELDQDAAYDAILVVSFGGPEGPDDVMPFLENVLRGRNVPRERMLEVAEHYQHFGGVSPINQQCRDFIAALDQELSEHGPRLPIYWGNRNWHPMLVDTLQQMADDGVQRAIAFVTSAFSSYSGCRQYRENIIAARQAVGATAPVIDKLRVFFNHPGFVDAMADGLQDALARFSDEQRANLHVAFTAHSIPLSMAETSKYLTQLDEACRLVAEQAGITDFNLVFQSRSGPPSQPWLEPDICDYIRQLKDERNLQNLVIVPIGFLSDHMEVLYDLDTEAKQVCDELDIEFVRSATAGIHPRLIAAVRDLIDERITGRSEKAFLGCLGASHDVCPVDCCPPPTRPTGRPGGGPPA